jgi:broad specificity phosphatase PhoE
MGALQGMLHETARPFLNFFEENPDVKVPQGEKFRTFYNRFKGAFDSLVSYSRKFPDAKPAVFTHSQDLALIEWFLEGKEPGGILKVPDKMAPGSIFEVNVEGDKITMRKVKV